jgi:two-component system chemotaxis response regulator CheB
VSEGVEGVVPGRGTVVIAPGGRHLVLRRRRLLGPTTAPGAVARASAGAHPAGPLGPVEVHLTDDPPESSCRPAVDPLLRSAVEVHGARVLAVVLTGMGSDGLRGCEAVVRAGGQVIAQDAATSVVWGMPGEVARAGLADAVLPLERVAAEITRRVAVGRPPTTAPSASTGAARVPASHGGPPATLSGWARPRGAA